MNKSPGRTINLWLVVAFLSGCAGFPNRVESRAISKQELVTIFTTPPQYQSGYCGSDKEHHYFVKWRYGAMLVTFGPRQYLEAYKVRRSELPLNFEAPLSHDDAQWHPFSIKGKTVQINPRPGL